MHPISKRMHANSFHFVNMTLKCTPPPPVLDMVLISDGNSELGAHIRKNLLFDLFKALD